MILSILWTSALFSQDSPIPITVINGETLSQQGTQYLGLKDMAGIKIGAVNVDGDKVGNSTWLGFQSSYGYNIVDNVNVHGHIGLDHDGLAPDPGSGSQTQTEFIAGLGVSYIYPLGNSALFIGGSVGGGSYNWKDDTGSSSSEISSDLLEYSLGVKYPFLINDGNSLAVYANYIVENETIDDQEIDFSGISFGFGTYNFNTNDRFDVCHSGNGSTFADGHYQTGDYAIGGNTGLNVQIGTNTNSFESGGTTFESEDALTNIDFQFDMLYYVTNGIGVRGNFNYNLWKQCDPDSDASNSASNLVVTAGAQYHIDAICPSFYGFGEFGAGTAGFTNTNSSGDESSDSEGVFKFSFGVGDIYFIAPNLALNPELFYTSTSLGDPTLRDSGLAATLGFVAFLDY